MIGIRVLAKGRRTLLDTTLTSPKKTIQERAPTELRSGTADNDCSDELAKEWMRGNLYKGVHTVCRLHVSALCKV